MNISEEQEKSTKPRSPTEISSKELAPVQYPL